LTCTAAPAHHRSHLSIWQAVILFLATGAGLFRFFDIAKLRPASFFDRQVRGGAGVMLDDLAAAIYANIALRLIAHFIL
jgi:phosphatidylglycerophosphatase A